MELASLDNRLCTAGDYFLCHLCSGTTVDTERKRASICHYGFQNGGTHVGKVVMDRNLCAMAGGFPGENASLLDFAKRIGYLYCWGRKDPFSDQSMEQRMNLIYFMMKRDTDSLWVRSLTPVLH